MKSILKLSAIVLLLFISFGCEQDDDATVNYVSFQDSPLAVAVDFNGSNSVDYMVYTGNISGSDRSFDIMVNASGTSADPSSYTIPSSVTIPANSNEGVFTIDFVDNNIRNSGETLSIMFDANSTDAFVSPPMVINISRNCESDLAGTYEVLSSGSSTDTAPVNNPIVDFMYTVTITEVADKSYTISDGVAGLYQEWYCDAYGYCFETEGKFTDTCAILSGSWVEAFDSTITLTGTDNLDGTLTITWTNGFGDTATATYTRI